MNIKELKELIDVFNQAGIEELEIEREGTKIRLRRSATTQVIPAVNTVKVQEITAAPVQEAASLQKPEEKRQRLCRQKTTLEKWWLRL